MGWKECSQVDEKLKLFDCALATRAVGPHFVIPSIVMQLTHQLWRLA